MATNASPRREEAQIRERLDAWTEALHAKDLDGLVALYGPDTVTFDLMPPAQVDGIDHYRKNFERWFAAMPGPISYEIMICGSRRALTSRSVTAWATSGRRGRTERKPITASA